MERSCCHKIHKSSKKEESLHLNSVEQKEVCLCGLYED